MNYEKRYNTLSPYLRKRYGDRVGKICIDGGFTCPNRDGTCGVGGCIFCGERGAGEHINKEYTIERQVSAFMHSGAVKKASVYVAYFQNFTNTHEAPDVLRQRYDAALTDERIKILAVGTRPDCIDEDRTDLLAEYTDRYDVWCELGFQTSNDDTARLFHRGYETRRFTEAVELLHARGIDVIAHMMIGLPGETENDVYETVRFVSSHPVVGVKLHSLYVTEGTALCDMYRRNEYTPGTMDEYVRIVSGAIARLRPDIILHRVMADAPRAELVAPQWNLEKDTVIKKIDRYMNENGLYQGSLWQK